MQKTTTLFYDQSGAQTSPSSSFLLCSCCWPSRKSNRETGNNSPSTLHVPESIVSFRRDSVRTKKPSTHSLYLSFSDLKRASSPTRNQLEVLTGRHSDVGSVNDQPYLTARTSRSTDERQYKSMPTLVEEIRAEFLGKDHFDNMKSEFMTFFRGGAEKPLLSSANIMPLDLPPFPLDSNKPIKEQMKLDLSPVELDSSSQPQTSHSTIYEHSLVPIRPFVSFFQRSIVRLPDHTYRLTEIGQASILNLKSE